MSTSNYDYSIMNLQKQLPKGRLYSFLCLGHNKKRSVLEEHIRLTGVRPGHCLWPDELKDKFPQKRLDEMYCYLRDKRRVPDKFDEAYRYPHY